MADAPWRCSQCGTVNEPVANACRTCGRWPSLFDIEESKVEDFDLEAEESATAVGVEVLEPESAQSFEPEEFDVEERPADPAPETPSARGRRLIGRVIVPLGVVIYLLIMLVTNR
jgi:predicted ATP-dependent serine protease